MRLVFVLVVTLILSACGSSSSNPASPSTPSIAQVSGNWAITTRLTGVTGGECVGVLLQTAIGGTDTGTLSVTQSGANLTATYRSTDSGLSCNYTGTAGSGSLALSATTCTAIALTGIRCINGALRDMRIVGENVNATVSGRTATGTNATTYNVFVAGTQSSVGVLTTNETFTATLQ
jgi:hypothetical protein